MDSDKGSDDPKLAKVPLIGHHRSIRALSYSSKALYYDPKAKLTKPGFRGLPLEWFNKRIELAQ